MNRDQLPPIIIIGTRGHKTDLERLGRRLPDAAVFKGMESFDHWRRKLDARTAIKPHVAAALEELGLVPSSLPPVVNAFLERLSAHHVVPKLADLYAASERRDLYRKWKSAVPETMKRFLRRVRLIHALHVLDHAGLHRKAAAAEAGFRDRDHFEREAKHFSRPLPRIG